jgi:hypothetical protein
MLQLYSDSIRRSLGRKLEMSLEAEHFLGRFPSKIVRLFWDSKSERLVVWVTSGPA